MVPNLVGLTTNHAKSTWINRGFTGPITYSPSAPPHYTITAQSLAAETSVECTSGITVEGTP
jgi:hypothetical protein